VSQVKERARALRCRCLALSIIQPGVRYGWVVVDIPVPPLADFDTAQRFHRLVLLHVALLRQRGDPVGMHQFLLGQVLGLHEPVQGSPARCAECGQPCPCRTVLLAAVLTRLPVPWTPVTLAKALSAARLLPDYEPDTDVFTAGRLEWGDRTQADPWYCADLDARSGSWVVRTFERGSLWRTEQLAGDQDLCRLLIDQSMQNVFPYGWVKDIASMAVVAAGAPDALDWWQVHARLPYLDSWRADGAWTTDPR